MALQDPSTPWSWVPPEWSPADPLALDPSAPLAGTILDLPKQFIPPDPQMPAQPRTVNGIPMPEYDDDPTRGDAPAPWSQEDGWGGNRGGGARFPWEAQPPAQRPRDDSARIGTFGTPAGGEVPRSAQALTAQEEAQIEIDPFASSPGYIEMPDDFVGRETIEMPDDFVGQAGPQPIDPYGLDADAISGGAVDGQPGAGPQPLDPYAAEPDARAPGMPDEYYDETELAAKYSALDPEAYETLRIKQQLAREDELATRQLDEMRKNREQAERNHNAEMQARDRAAQASAEVDAEARKLAQVDITDDAWMESRSPMQKVAAFAAAILGGLASGQTGGRNLGLEAIQRTISQHTENLRANLANKRGLLGERRGSIANQYAQDMDASRSAEVHRQAMYESTIRGLEVEMQKYDPRGTTAMRIAEGMRGLRAQDAQAKAAWEKENFKNSLEISKFQLDQDKHLLEVAKSQPDILLKMKKLQGGAGTGVKQSPEYYKALRLPQPPWAMSEKEHATWMQRQKTAKELGGNDAKSRKESADATKAEAEAAAADGGYFVRHPETGEPLAGKDGKPVPIMDALKRDRTDKVLGAAKNIRLLADRMKALRDRNGGSWTTLGSDEAQEMKQLVSMIDFETFKAFDLGAPSAGDKDLAEGVRGGADPTSFIKNATAGFQAYANAVELKANTALRQAGIEPIKFTRRADAPKAKASIVDGMAGELAKAKYEPADPSKPFGTIVAPDIANRNKLVEEKFTALEAFADQPGDQGDQARKALKVLADTAVSGAVRTRAKALLDATGGIKESGQGEYPSAARTSEAR